MLPTFLAACDVLSLSQEGDVVEVDAETAAVLRSSRFAKEFLIQPAAGRVPAPGGCCRVKAKVGDKLGDC